MPCQCLTLAFAKKVALQNCMPEEIVIVLLVSLANDNVPQAIPSGNQHNLGLTH